MTTHDKIYKNKLGLLNLAEMLDIQKDLDLWLEYYNQQRTHSGKYCFGRTPHQTFLDTVDLAKEKMLPTLVQQPVPHSFSEPALTLQPEGMGPKKNESNYTGSGNFTLSQTPVR